VLFGMFWVAIVMGVVLRIARYRVHDDDHPPDDGWGA
jgi:hypothetical protein